MSCPISAHRRYAHYTELAGELVKLAADPVLQALDVPGRRDHPERLLKSPTMPAIHRYTGVLYDALDVESLSRAATAGRRRGWPSVRPCSACCGPTTRYPPALRRFQSCPADPGWPRGGAPFSSRCWPMQPPRELVVDLRSGAYVGLGRLKSAVLTSTCWPSTTTGAARCQPLQQSAQGSAEYTRALADPGLPNLGDAAANGRR